MSMRKVNLVLVSLIKGITLRSYKVAQQALLLYFGLTLNSGLKSMITKQSLRRIDITKIVKKAFILPLLFSVIYCTTSPNKSIDSSSENEPLLIPINICENEWFWFQTDNCIARLINPRPINTKILISEQNKLEVYEKNFAGAMNAYTAILISAKRDVERSSLKRINLTILGILSSISAAVLATSSPANAAAVAGLAALSSGIITYQGVLSEEGQSRSALNRVFLKLQDRQVALHKEFNANYLAAAASENSDHVKYNESTAKIKLTILELYTFAYKIPSIATEDEIKQSKERTAVSKNLLEEEFKKLKDEMARAKGDDGKKEVLSNFKKKVTEILENYISGQK